MKLIHPELSLEVTFFEDTVNELIIENEAFFYHTVSDFYNQSCHCSGSYILSEKNEPVDFSKHVELITQFIPFEMNRKTLLTKLYAKLKGIALEPDYYIKTAETSQLIYKYLNQIISETDSSITFDTDSDFEIQSLFKAVNVRFNDDFDTLSEKITDYMLNVRQYEGEKLFILVNYRNYVCKNEAEEFFRTVVGHKIKLLLIEGSEREKLLFEKRIIIDSKMCEIY